MTDKSFSEQAAFLIEDALDLIKQVLVKHSAAVLEEMRDQIVKRNDEIKRLTTELDAANAKGYDAVKLAMAHEDTANRLTAELNKRTDKRSLT